MKDPIIKIADYLLLGSARVGVHKIATSPEFNGGGPQGEPCLLL